MTVGYISDLTEYNVGQLKDLSRHFTPDSLEKDMIFPEGNWSPMRRVRFAAGKFHPFCGETVASDEYLRLGLGAARGWKEAESGAIELVVNGYRYDIAPLAVDEVRASTVGWELYTPKPLGLAEPMEMRALGNIDIPAIDPEFATVGFQEEETAGPVSRGYLYVGWQNLIMTIRVSNPHREVYERQFAAMTENAEQIFSNLIADIRIEE